MYPCGLCCSAGCDTTIWLCLTQQCAKSRLAPPCRAARLIAKSPRVMPLHCVSCTSSSTGYYDSRYCIVLACSVLTYAALCCSSWYCRFCNAPRRIALYHILLNDTVWRCMLLRAVVLCCGAACHGAMRMSYIIIWCQIGALHSLAPRAISYRVVSP